MSYKISKQHQINRPAISVKSKYDNNYSFANEQEEPPAEYNFTDSPEFEEDQDISEDDLNSISIATIGDSDSLQVGDGVVAIGNALGMGQSVTSGVVSALNREVTVEDTTSTLLQTDAAINPGNSGGALFNMKGELIGINSAKYASDTVEGMGFAIPINEAKTIIDELIKTGYIKRPFLGVGSVYLDAETAKAYGIPSGIGIKQVVEGSAAQKAGLVPGDIITEIEGNKVESGDDLTNIMNKKW